MLRKEYKYYSLFFIVFMTWSSIYTLITLYLNESIGFSVQTVGVFMSLIPLVTLLFQPLWGALSDALGSRKRIVLGLILGTMTVTLLMIFVHQKWLVLVLYSFYILFICGQNPILDSMAINFVNHEGKGTYGGVRVWGSLGYAIGALIFAYFADLWGLGSIFVIASIGYFISFLGTRTIYEYPLQPIKGRYFKDLKQLLKQADYVWVLIFAFLLVGSFNGGEQYLSMYIRSNGIPVGQLGILNFIAVLVELPCIFYSKRFIQRLGYRPIMILITVVSMLRMVLIGLSSYFAMFVIVGVMRGLVVGLYIPIFVELISDITIKELSTSAISIYMAISTGIAVFLFTFLGSFVAAMSYEWLFFAYGIVSFLALMIIPKIKTPQVE